MTKRQIVKQLRERLERAIRGMVDYRDALGLPYTTRDRAYQAAAIEHLAQAIRALEGK